MTISGVSAVRGNVVLSRPIQRPRYYSKFRTVTVPSRPSYIKRLKIWSGKAVSDVKKSIGNAWQKCKGSVGVLYSKVGRWCASSVRWASNSLRKYKSRRRWMKCHFRKIEDRFIDTRYRLSADLSAAELSSIIRERRDGGKSVKVMSVDEKKQWKRGRVGSSIAIMRVRQLVDRNTDIFRELLELYRKFIYIYGNIVQISGDKQLAYKELVELVMKQIGDKVGGLDKNKDVAALVEFIKKKSLELKVSSSFGRDGSLVSRLIGCGAVAAMPLLVVNMEGLNARLGERKGALEQSFREFGEKLEGFDYKKRFAILKKRVQIDLQSFDEATVARVLGDLHYLETGLDQLCEVYNKIQQRVVPELEDMHGLEVSRLRAGLSAIAT